MDNETRWKGLIEHLKKDGYLNIVLTEGEGKNVRRVSSFRIAPEMCSGIFFSPINKKEIGIGFPRKPFLMACIGNNRKEDLINKGKEIISNLNKTRAVLGDVPAANKLEESVRGFIKAINRFFDYDESKLIEEPIYLDKQE